MKNHVAHFWMGLVGRLGPPIFAATLVACFLAGEFRTIHGVLMAVGLAMIYCHHRVCEHED